MNSRQSVCRAPESPSFYWPWEATHTHTHRSQKAVLFSLNTLISTHHSWIMFEKSSKSDI